MRNTRTGCAPGTTTPSSAPGASRCRPATSSATTGARPRPTSRARAIYIGIKNPAIDALIERVIFAKNRAELVAATKALDRVLLWNHFVVPQWTYGKVRTARWDRFGHPDEHAAIRRGGVPDRLVVGRAEGGQDGIASVTAPLRSHAPQRLGARRRRGGDAGRRRRFSRREALAQDGERHGMSGFGDLKYPADFKHFEYVNPNAPKGGLFSQIGSTRQFNQNFLTFNSLNSYIFRGDAALGMELTFATLMKRAGDEPDAMYGLGGARGADFARRPDLSLPDAAGGEIPRRQPHDGARRRLLAEHPQGEGPSDHHPAHARRRPASRRPTTRPWSCASRPDAAATCRCSWRRCRSSRAPIMQSATFDETTLEVPLGSGAYKVGKFEVGRFIEYDRVKDWWGADLPVSVGHEQFRRRPLRILSRPRRRVRRLHRPQLSVPRGVHLAHLGDALQFSGDQGRPRQAGRAARRHAVRRAGLVLQHPAREVQEPDAARSASSWRSTSSGPTSRSCTGPTTGPIRCSRIPT